MSWTERYKQPLELMKSNIDKYTNKENPLYNIESTDDAYFFLRDCKDNVMEELSSRNNSEAVKQNLHNLLKEINNLMELIRGAISEQAVMDLEGGFKKRRNKSRSRRNKSRRKRNKSRRKRNKSRRHYK